MDYVIEIIAIDSGGKPVSVAVQASRGESSAAVIARWSGVEWEPVHAIRPSGPMDLPPCFSFNQHCLEALSTLR